MNKGLTKDEAQRMGSFAKLPDLIRGPQAEASPLALLEPRCEAVHGTNNKGQREAHVYLGISVSILRYLPR